MPTISRRRSIISKLDSRMRKLLRLAQIVRIQEVQALHQRILSIALLEGIDPLILIGPFPFRQSCEILDLIAANHKIYSWIISRRYLTNRIYLKRDHWDVHMESLLDGNEMNFKADVRQVDCG